MKDKMKLLAALLVALSLGAARTTLLAVVAAIPGHDVVS